MTKGDVMRVGLRKTVGMLKSKGQGCGVGGGTLQQMNFATFIVATACKETSVSKHWRNRNRFKRAVLLWLPGRKKSGSCPSRKGQEKEKKNTLVWAWQGMAEGASAVFQPQH